MNASPHAAPVRRAVSARDALRAALLRLALLLGVIVVFGCAGPLPNRDPVGETFPTVAGESLEQEARELPTALAGGPAVLLVGYEQRAQFDIDRWLMGLLQAEVDAAIVEVPTIPGLVPTAISGWIDDGMRAGIPREDWGAVVTVYGDDAEPIAALTGTENGQNARVLLLDGTGRVVWFHDRGYSAREALALTRAAEALARE